ncbi:hypothetical protein MHYP_G00303940 [Metynnis hypsauchen]
MQGQTCVQLSYTVYFPQTSAKTKAPTFASTSFHSIRVFPVPYTTVKARAKMEKAITGAVAVWAEHLSETQAAPPPYGLATALSAGCCSYQTAPIPGPAWGPVLHRRSSTLICQQISPTTSTIAIGLR